MKKPNVYLIVSLILTSLLSGCAQTPQPGQVPTVEEVIARRKTPTSEEAQQFCLSKGGHFEQWKNEDGTSTTYCIMPEGYGCDPILFAQGLCGKEDF